MFYFRKGGGGGGRGRSSMESIILRVDPGELIASDKDIRDGPPFPDTESLDPTIGNREGKRGPRPSNCRKEIRL